MNTTKLVKVTHVYTGVSKNTGSRFASLSGVELASKNSDSEFGRPVFDDFLSNRILDEWDDVKLLDLARNKSIVAIEIANFKDKQNPDKWVSVPVGLSLSGDFEI